MSDSPPNFVHLHVHSHYSMLDGMGKIPDLVKKAKADGQTALALTDHGNMHGAVEFYETCKKEGIKPIIGIEAYVAPRKLTDKQPRIDASPYHLILLAKNETGYKNLLKLTTIAHLEGYYYKPRIDKETLKKYSEGLIASSACLQGEIPRKALENIEEGRKAIREYLEIFSKDDLILEIQRHPNTVPEQKQSNKNIQKLAEEFGLKVIATNDPHYVNTDDAIAQDALLCLQTGKLMTDENRMSMTGDDYSLLTQEQIFQNFSDYPEAIANTLEIAKKCNLKLNLGGIIIPDFPVPADYDLDSWFKHKCYLGLNWRYGKGKLTDKDLPRDRKPNADDLKISKKIWERYQYEYGVIAHMGYQGYILIVADYVQWAKDQKIAVGPGRGSGAGSIICYALNITNLDPLEYGLLFERFLNPDRVSMPDIDMDFADSRRGEVIEYVTKKYGKDHVAQIITFGTMAARMAIRDVGRVLGMSYAEVDAIAKLIPVGMTLEESLVNIVELKALYGSDAQVAQCINIAKKLEGVVRHSSMHAAGVVISKEPLVEYCPLQEAQKGDLSIVTQYSMNPIEHLGLLKMDFLGLSNLTIIQEALSIIRKTKEKNIDIDALALDDKKTYQLLAKGETTGVFQLESDGMKRYLKELKPTVFEDITAMVALYRPGPIQWIDSFVARKHGREPISYIHPKAKAALENTYGIIVYQEQLMQMSEDMAGFSGGQADTLRKATGKKIKELMEKIGKEFIAGCIKNGINKAIAQELYSSMQNFAQYSFNKSHAACYAMIAYQTAYLKAHYPSEFMAALMTSNKDDLDKLAMEIDECKKMSIEVMPPSVNESFVNFGVVKETGNIRFGLSAIKNVGENVAEEIVEERKKGGRYNNIEDFLTRLSGKVINKKSLESLCMAGAFSDLAERNLLLFNMEGILGFASGMNKLKNDHQTSLFSDSTTIENARLDLKDTQPADKKQILSWERELLGMYISEHPLSGIGHLIEPNRTIRLADIAAQNENEFVRIAGVITSIQKILTRSSQKMIFAKIEDLQTKAEILVFPKLLENNNDIIQNDKIVAVDGYVSFKDGALKILAENIYELKDGINIPEFVARENKRGGRFNGNGNGNIGPSPQPPQSPQNNLLIEQKNLLIIVPEHFAKEHLLELKEILSNHPGLSEVILRVTNGPTSVADGNLRGASTTREIKIKNKIEIDPVLLRKTRELVGKENVEEI